jgi:hypothetical protein
MDNMRTLAVTSDASPIVNSQQRLGLNVWTLKLHDVVQGDEVVVT